MVIYRILLHFDPQFGPFLGHNPDVFKIEGREVGSIVPVFSRDRINNIVRIIVVLCRKRRHRRKIITILYVGIISIANAAFCLPLIDAVTEKFVVIMYTDDSPAWEKI